MAVIDLVLPDAEKELFARQARREGMSFSDWIKAAAEDRIAGRRTLDPSLDVEETNRALENPDTKA